MTNKYADLSDHALRERLQRASVRGDKEAMSAIADEMKRRGITDAKLTEVGADAVKLDLPNEDRFARLVLGLHAHVHLLIVEVSEPTELEGLTALITAIRLMAVELETSLVTAVNGSGVALLTDEMLRRKLQELDRSVAVKVSDARWDEVVADVVNATRGTHAFLQDETIEAGIAAWEITGAMLDRSVETFTKDDINPRLN